ncbi:hypothetical protein HNQ91_000949 [Filimonas zeae]|uniref:YcxB-like C-terminal domain-containing protein n=1 Tax=Filimonas zeae TaxID=1737353 RepID=A0A917IPZ0_9BACT|nr:YcxB family protein [Filimonas zeae]MDR6337927.1 hypothetical protein [Filimonas zeae]GGH60906.1 hypothetical protein GCM10011379_09290 [Filimonas zeae]
MEPFTIITSLSKSEYKSWLLHTNTRRPFAILQHILGPAMIVFSFYMYYITNGSISFPWPTLLVGLFFIFIPYFFTWLGALKFYNTALAQENTYVFSEEHVTVNSSTATATMTWDHFIKWKEYKNIMILYVSKNVAHLIKTESMTPEQIDFIRSKIPAKK